MIVRLLELIFSLYILMLFVRVMSSWIPQIAQSRPIAFVAKLTDPYLNLFRRFIPPIGGVLDISPILAFFALQFFQKFCLSLFLR